MSVFFRLCLMTVVLCSVTFTASAKYCVKLPSCEELGYLFPHKEGRREIKCPFDTSKVLYLDYCQAYGLSSMPQQQMVNGKLEFPGEFEECIETKADGTKINTGYYRYTRCNAGFVYEKGNCVPVPHYDLGDIYKYNDTPIGIVFNVDDKTINIIALNDINSSGTETHDKQLYWSASSSGSSSYYDVTDLTNYVSTDDAITDMSGKNNTDKIIAYSTANSKPAQAATATRLYAPSVCPEDSKCGKGKWHLPSVGEFLTMYKYEETLNTQLTSAGGTVMNNTGYWTSTEYGRNRAWMFFNDGSCAHLNKDANAYVRPMLVINK